ncbi:MAG: NAD(P)/FAD-dependent oxidoreductase [Lachnospiraceae bacterium]|nr:NAD(P)/FAD-dependent oxidoreductase [Lachnospiraceae bacterium]
MSKQILVVGGGAAGMAAAWAAAKAGASVTLLEKNEKLGKKVYITGKGRCNVTNACPPEDLIRNVMSNPRFLYSAFRQFSNEALMTLLEENGCPLKTERGQRVFPVSDHASDVTRTFERLLKQYGVRILLNHAVQNLEIEKEEIRGAWVRPKDALTPEFFPCGALILSTGGLSYPSTGSTGDGHRMAGQCGHELVSCLPSLVPLTTAEEWPKTLSGLTLKNAEASLWNGEALLGKEFGELLFTHFGISGPTVLTLSSRFGREIASSLNPIVRLDLKPALDRETLDRRLQKEVREHPKQFLQTILQELLPKALIPVILQCAGTDGKRFGADLQKEERLRLADAMKALTLHVSGTGGFSEAIVTKGGVSVKDVSPSTMESKRVHGLYFAGELLDVDALTGGFNLQIAWSTGVLAGKQAAKE